MRMGNSIDKPQGSYISCFSVNFANLVRISIAPPFEIKSDAELIGKNLSNY